MSILLSGYHTSTKRCRFGGAKRLWSVIGWVVVCYTVCFNTAVASSLSVKVVDSRVDIEANQVAVGDVLKAISDQTGIVLNLIEDLREPISLHLKGISIETCIQQLMVNQNYVLLFKKLGDHEFIPIELRVFESGTVIAEDNKPIQTPAYSDTNQLAAPHPNDPMKPYDRDTFWQEFGDGDRLVGQITADTEAYGEGIEDIGIRITGIAQNSPFKKIGLEPGNIIQNVNGRSTRNLDDLIQGIHAAYEEGTPMIRIARQNNNHKFDPIYINFMRHQH